MSGPGIHGRTHAAGGTDPIPNSAGDGIQFDTNPQDGGFLWATTSTGPINLEDHSGDGLYLRSEDGDGENGYVSITTATGTVFIAADAITNRLNEFGEYTLQDSFSDPIVKIQETGVISLLLRTGQRLEVFNAGAGHVFTVYEDGRIAIPGLPTSPGATGELWNDSGTVKVA